MVEKVCLSLLGYINYLEYHYIEYHLEQLISINQQSPSKRGIENYAITKINLFCGQDKTWTGLRD